MRLYLIFLEFVCLMALTLKVQADYWNHFVDVKDPEQVRMIFHVIDYDEQMEKKRQRLIYMGELAFPAYEAIFTGPKVSPGEIAGIFGVIRIVETDRGRFVKYAVAHLTDPHRGVRWCAVYLLERIGTTTEAALMIALLSDEYDLVVKAAANVLANMGGPNEVVAMDVWLRGVSHREDADLRRHVLRCRDELKMRLEEFKNPAKRVQLRQQGWSDLTSREETKVHLSVRNMSAFGDDTVAFLKEHLHPAPDKMQKRLDELVSDLDSDSFDRRETATRELSRGIVAEAILDKELKNRPSLEKRRRLEAILEDFPKWREKNPELLRQFRAVWVLQQIGTPEARALLEKLATGAPSAALTHKAKDALQSLGRLNKKR